MPQAEKLKLKAESKMVVKEEESPILSDHKILVRHIHEAYMKNFNMNKAKARLILTGKTSKTVKQFVASKSNPNCVFNQCNITSPDNILSPNFPCSLSSFMTWIHSSWQRRL